MWWAALLFQVDCIGTAVWGSLKLHEHGRQSVFAWILCIWEDLGRVCVEITKELDTQPPLESPVLLTFQPRIRYLSLCIPQSDLWESLTTFLQKDIFLSFPFLAESLFPEELYREEKINIKQGIKTLGTMNLKLHHPSLISESPSPAEPGEKCGTSLW